MRLCLFLLALLTMGVAACDLDPIEPDDGEEPLAADTLDVLGHGVVQERFTAEVAARDQWAYTSTWSSRAGTPGNAIKVWNIAGSTPQLVDSLIVESAGTLGDLQISDDGALLVAATEGGLTGSIVIFDRAANPAHPVRLARHASDATRIAGVHTVKLGRVNGRHYAFLSVNPSPPRLVVVDITDPAAPVEVLAMTVDGRPFIHDVFVRDGLLFTALWNAGMTIWDIGGGGRAGASPANPVQIGNVQTVNGQVHNIWWYHATDGSKRYAFVGEEGPANLGASSQGDIHVVDVSDMTQPREVAFFSVPNAGTHNFVMDEEAGVLYAAYYNGGVRALDVTGDLSQCADNERGSNNRCNLGLMGRQVGVGLQNVGAISVWGVAKVGDVIYASDMLSGLYALDASELRAR
jgi:hypothetical protein